MRCKGPPLKAHWKYRSLFGEIIWIIGYFSDMGTKSQFRHDKTPIVVTRDDMFAKQGPLKVRTVTICARLSCVLFIHIWLSAGNAIIKLACPHDM